MFESLTALSVTTRWTLGVVFGLPLCMLLLTELAVRLRRQGRSRWAKPVLITRNLVLPVLALYIILLRAVGLPADGTTMKVVLTISFVCIINAVLTLLNVVLFDEAAEGSWQARVPKLLQDLGRLLLILIGLAIVLSTVWSVDLEKVVAALGVGSIVIGLAVQDPVGNLFSGLMLLFERPFSVGDWVKIDNTVGKIVEINWRAVHLLVRKTEIIVVPNSTLAKGNFTNISRPTREHAETLLLGFSYDDPPNKVKKVLLRLVRQTRGVLHDPAPSVQTFSYDNSSISYRLTFRVADFADLGPVRDEILTRLWYASKRHGLNMPFPIQTTIQVSQANLDAQARSPLPAETLARFASLGLAQTRGLEQALCQGAVHHYAQGEVVVARGELLVGLYLILKGEVSMTLQASDGGEKEVGRLTRGEFFGEKALLGSAPSEVTVTALEDLELIVLSGPTLQHLVDQTPQAAREIGLVFEARRQALRQRQSGNGQAGG